MSLIFMFFLGTVVGSFLIVVVDRIPKNLSIVSGRSFCDTCKHPLSWIDLVPIFSYLLQGGKCRYCKSKISPHYVYMELLVGALFATTYFFTAFSSQPSFYSPQLLMLLVYRLFLVSCFFVIFFIDLKHGVIPVSVLFVVLLASLFWIAFMDPSHILNHFLSGASAFLFFLLIHLVTRGRGMGFGDVLFAFVMGFVLGFPGIITGMYVAFLTGAAVALILIMLRKKKLHGDTIPFGPFLVIGAYASLFWGEMIVRTILPTFFL